MRIYKAVFGLWADWGLEVVVGVVGKKENICKKEVVVD